MFLLLKGKREARALGGKRSYTAFTKSAMSAAALP